MSPEVLNNTGICYAADLWALGCIIYQMLAGRPPFKGRSEYLTFQVMLQGCDGGPEVWQLGNLHSYGYSWQQDIMHSCTTLVMCGLLN